MFFERNILFAIIMAILLTLCYFEDGLLDLGKVSTKLAQRPSSKM